MLTLDPDKICHIVAKARVFDADMPEPDEDPGSDLGGDELEELELDEGEEAAAEEEDATEDEIRELVDAMNVDEQIELVALIWVGRGSFTVEEWGDAKAEAERAHNERTSDYILGIPLLADYLEEGLSAFGLSCD